MEPGRPAIKISVGMLLLGIDLMAVGLFPWLGLTGAPPWRLLLHILAITGGAGILLRRQGGPL
jgi:hypothetical protein